MWKARLLAALVVTTILVQPGSAFDDLIRFTSVIPDNPPSPYVFDYAAPLGGFSASSPTGYGPSDHLIGGALVGPAGPEAMTGVDFSKVTAVFTAGDPPRTITVLIGEPGFVDGAPDALTARGFTQNEIEGVPVFAFGEDYAVDVQQARNGDPLGGGMGKSQRLAIGGDYLLRSSGWPEMNRVLADLPRPSDQANLWAAAFEGLRSASGHEGHVDIASGWLATAFLDTGPGLETLSDPSAIDKLKTKTPDGYVPSPLTVIAMVQTPTTASVQIALPYGDERVAQQMAELIGDRLVLHPFTPSRPRTEVFLAEPYSIAVISIDTPVAEASAARDLYRQWMDDVMQRNFPPLSF